MKSKLKWHFLPVVSAALALCWNCAFAAAAEPAVAPRDSAVPTRVIGTSISVNVLKTVGSILQEFGKIRLLGAGTVFKPSVAMRSQVLTVLIEQNLIPATTPGAAASVPDAVRLKILYAIQSYGFAIDSQNTTNTNTGTGAGTGGGALPPPAPNSITDVELADGAVTTPKLASNAVTAAKLAAGSVVTAGLSDNAVTTPKIADLTVTAVKITSQQASSGMVLTADGLGGAAWGALAITSVSPTSGDSIILALDDFATTPGTLNPNVIKSGITNAQLTNSAVTINTDASLLGGGPLPLGGALTLKLSPTAVTPGAYPLANVTVDAQGRITAASSTPVLPVAQGGTGATTPAGALASLGAAGNGANSDITALNTLSVIKPPADSVTGIQLQTTGGTSIVNVDTTNKRVGINTAAPAADLDVAGTVKGIAFTGTSATLSGNTSVGGTLTVAGVTTFNNNVSLGSNSITSVQDVAAAGTVSTPGAVTTTGAGTITSAGTLTAATGAGGLVLGSGANATTFTSTATAPHTLNYPDKGGIVALLSDITSANFSGILPVINGGTGSSSSNANSVFAGPVSGAPGAPGFRALVAADVPSLDAGIITTGVLPIAQGGTGAGSGPAALLSLGAAAQGANSDITALFALGQIRPPADSVTAIQFQTTGGTALLNIDTVNKRIGVNTNAPVADLDVAGTLNATNISGSSQIIGGNDTVGGTLTVAGVSIFNNNVGLGGNSINGVKDLSASGDVASSGTVSTTGSGTITSAGTLTAATGAGGFVLGSGANATTFTSTATAARAVAFPDKAGIVAMLSDLNAGNFSGILPVANGGTGTSAANANSVFAGPVSGAPGAPGFRALVAADVPNLDASIISTGVLPIAQGGTGASSGPAALTSLGAAAQGVNNDITALLSLGLIRPAADGTTALTIQTTGGTSVLDVDTTNKRIGVNTSTPAADLDVNGTLKATNITGGTAALGGNTSVGGTLTVTGVSTFNNNASLGANSISTVKDVTATGNLTTSGTISTTGAGTITSSGTLTASKGAGGLVLGAGANATTFTSTATAARAVSFPDKAGVVAMLSDLTAGNFSGILPVANGGTGVTTTGANSVFAGPAAAAGAPSFRTLVAADLPSFDAAKITTGILPVANGGTGAAAGPAALTNLGAAARGANGDITSMTAVGAISGPGTLTFTAGGAGSVLFKPTGNSTSAIQFQNAASAAVLDVDTTNKRIGINTTAPAATLDVTGNAAISTTLAVTGASTLSGNTAVGGTLAVTGASTLTGNAALGGTLTVAGASTFTGAAALSNNLTVAGTSTLTGAASIGNTLTVTGASTFNNSVAISGVNTLTVGGASTLTGNASVGGTLTATGAATLNGATTVNNTLKATGATTLSTTLAVAGASTLTGATTVGSTLNVTGATTLSSTLSAAATTLTSTLSVAGASTLTGNTTVGGTLGVTGATTLTGAATLGNNLSVAGASTLTGNTAVGGTLTATGATQINNTFKATGATTLSSTLAVTGAATLSSTLAVTGASTLTGNVTFGGQLQGAGSAAGSNKYAERRTIGAAAAGTPISIANSQIAATSVVVITYEGVTAGQTCQISTRAVGSITVVFTKATVVGDVLNYVVINP